MGTDSPSVKVTVGVLSTVRECAVPNGTTVAEALAIFARGLGEGEQKTRDLIDEGWQISADGEPVSLYKPLTRDTCLSVVPGKIRGEAELGRRDITETLDELHIELSEIQTRLGQFRQIRVDLDYLAGKKPVYAKANDSAKKIGTSSSYLTFPQFWVRFGRHLLSNFRRYFWPWFLASVVVLVGLTVGFYYFEKDNQNSIDTLMDAFYAVWMFTMTVGYRPDSLTTGGKLIGAAASLIGLIVFGLIVSLIFYSLED